MTYLSEQKLRQVTKGITFDLCLSTPFRPMQNSTRLLCFKLIFTSLLALYTQLGYGQESTPNYIKTIQVRKAKNGSQTNMSPLGQPLFFSFDDLEADQKNYYYKVQHMTHDWKPTRMLSSQYIDGFQQNIILDVDNSFNTFQSYSHYNFAIPNRNTVLTKSGNYLISVLDDQDELIFSRRVTFYEKAATVGVSVSRSREALNSNQDQTVQFLVNHPGIRINFPDRELFVAILQNQNWKTNIEGIQPQFFKQNQLVYRYTTKTNFKGGNEYLNFDTKLIQNQTVTVQRIVRKEVFYSYLYPYDSREVKNYTFSPDINGQFLIQTNERADANLESDYAMMHFYLRPQEHEKDLDLYVYGAFNNFACNQANRMKYNPDSGMFEAVMLLKQGFYNYTFAAKSGKRIDPGAILGNFSKTENRYDVVVYYNPVGGLYERAIGLGTIRFEGEF